jgi:hypothetical protein
VPETYNVTTLGASETCPDDLSEKFSHELSGMNVKVTSNNLLNNDILDKIGRIYAVDYKYFRYSPSILGMPPGSIDTTLS